MATIVFRPGEVSQVSAETMRPDGASGVLMLTGQRLIWECTDNCSSTAPPVMEWSVPKLHSIHIKSDDSRLIMLAFCCSDSPEIKLVFSSPHERNLIRDCLLKLLVDYRNSKALAVPIPYENVPPS